MNCPECGSKAKTLPSHRGLQESCQCGNPACMKIFERSETTVDLMTERRAEAERRREARMQMQAQAVGQ